MGLGRNRRELADGVHHFSDLDVYQDMIQLYVSGFVLCIYIYILVVCVDRAGPWTSSLALRYSKF